MGIESITSAWGLDFAALWVNQKIIKYTGNIMKQVLYELKTVKRKNSLDIMAFKFREALRISLEINQKFDIEDVLDIIFKDFCIGK